MGRIEDDWRPPLGRLHDLEWGRRFAVQLGHPPLPSLKSASLDGLFRPEKRKFYENALSVIATDLPSEKSPKPAGTVLTSGKRLPSLLCAAFRYRNSLTFCRPRRTSFHPKFTVCQA